MNLTPQVINDVEFRQRVRGYDPDEVDDFLEKVAAGVSQLLERTREAHERAQAAERRAVELEKRGRDVPAVAAVAEPVASDEPDILRRTLVLAQRTADAAVAEAKEMAQQIVAEAQQSAAKLLSEAEGQGHQLVADAEVEARRSADDTRQRLVVEIIGLEETRDSIRSDVSLLERHLDDQRLRLRSSITEMQRLLDDPARLRMAPLPGLSEAELSDDDREPGALEAGADDDAAEIVLDDVAASPRPQPGETGFDDAIDEEAWARFTGEVPVVDSGGPPTAPVDRFAPGDERHERFAPVGPDESDLFEPENGSLRGRFGRRR